jgi:hypothetical protein
VERLGGGGPIDALARAGDRVDPVGRGFQLRRAHAAGGPLLELIGRGLFVAPASSLSHLTAVEQAAHAPWARRDATRSPAARRPACSRSKPWCASRPTSSACVVTSPEAGGGCRGATFRRRRGGLMIFDDQIR